MIRAKIEGDSLEGLADEIYEGELEPRMVAAVNDATEILERAVERELSRRGPPREGDAPAYRTGELHKSIHRTPAKKRKRSVRGDVRSQLEQSARLEFGGTDSKGRYLPPHPYWRPAEEAAKGAILDRMDEI